MAKLLKYFLILILFLSFITSLFSQELELYRKGGDDNDYVLSNKMKIIDSLSLHNYLEEIIISDYSKGYITAGYDSIVYDTLKNITAYYTLGNKYKWGEIDFNEADGIKRLHVDKIKKKGSINIFEINSVFKEILIHYANNGYPFTSVGLDSVGILDDQTVNAKVKIDPGNKFFFDSIIVKGNVRIKQYYIEKYLGIKKGDVFSLKKIENIDKNIKNIPFLSQSRSYELAFTEDKADVLLYLQNKKANQFTGLIGILPNNKTTGKLLITGDINLYLLNSLGIGELFSVQWQKFEALSQTLKTEISVPYLFKTDFGAGVQLNIEKKDSSYLNTDFTGKILFGSNTGTGLDFFYRNNSSFILKKAAENITDNFNSYNINLIGLGYRFSSLNSIHNPQYGIILKISSGFGTKAYSTKVETGEESEKKPIFQNKSVLDISGFIPIGRVMAIKLRNLTSITYSKVIFDNELDLIGGLSTIRGFDELSMPASSYSIANLEFRYLFEEESALFAFYDVGYFEKRFTSNNNNNYAMGMGVGLDLRTPAGIFSIVYALGKQNENPFQFNNSKIHFGYKNYF